MEFKDLYLKRRTCRSYKPIEVEEDKLTYILDAGSIIENMCLAASDLDLGSTFSYSVARLIAASKECLEILNVPTDYKILSGMFVGYIDCPNMTNVDHVIKVIK